PARPIRTCRSAGGPVTYPREAYPVAVYSSDTRAALESIRVESTADSVMLWICGLMIGASRGMDDTHLEAAQETAWAISQAAERFGAQIRAELEKRQAAREAESSAAAMRAAARSAEAPDHYPTFSGG